MGRPVRWGILLVLAHGCTYGQDETIYCGENASISRGSTGNLSCVCNSGWDGDGITCVEVVLPPPDAGPPPVPDAGKGVSIPCNVGVVSSGDQQYCPSGMVCAGGLTRATNGNPRESYYTSCEIPHYTEALGLVTDEVTGLVWNSATKPFYCGLDPTGVCESTRPWRLPTVAELYSLVQLGMTPSIDQTEFPNTPPQAFFWSSSSRGGYWPLYAWFVGFDQGQVLMNPATNSCAVRCVRSP